MFEKKDRLVYIIGKHFRNELTTEEKQELEEWLSEKEEHRKLFAQLSDSKIMEKKISLYLDSEIPDAWAKVQQRIKGLQPIVIKNSTPSKKKYPLWTVVALAVCFTGACFIWMNNKTLPDKKARVLPNQPTSNLPKIFREAKLTLSDGTTISLNSNKKNTIAPQGVYQVKINKDDLYYKTSDLGSSSVKEIYNIIETPNMRQFRVIFTDGKSASSIRMNVASYLRFNVSTAVQKVTLKGEAEFEIAHKPNNKFFVMLPSGNNNEIEKKVEVTGTRFNINAYENDYLQKITLLEGTINVSAAGNLPSEFSTALLATPCQQAQIKENGKINIIPHVDTATEVSWKKGIVSFNRFSAQQLLKTIEKWYDIKIVYKHTNVPDCLFTGKITPETDIETVLDIMQFQCDDLHIKFDSTNKTITVLP